MKNKSLWEYIIKDHNYIAPICATIGLLLLAGFTGTWIPFLIATGVLWIFTFTVIFFDSRLLRRIDIDIATRKPLSCPKCGHKTKSNYCENCGNRLIELYHPEPAKTKCTHCGHPCTSKYCGYCGAPQ